MVEKDPQLSALNVGELDLFVDSMEPSRMESIGNPGWVDWHLRLQKLNQQAVLEASTMQEERTKETLISSGKVIQVYSQYSNVRIEEPKKMRLFTKFTQFYYFVYILQIQTHLLQNEDEIALQLNYCFFEKLRVNMYGLRSHLKCMLPVLVYEAICIQVWRTKIYPQIIKLEPAPENTFCVYMVLYHEAAAVGLLETVLFHEDGAQCIVEVVVDLLHYAVDQLTALLTLINNDYLKPLSDKVLESETAIEELDRQKRDLQFDISMRCISIVRYIAEHMEVGGAGASISTNLYKTHDVPSLLSHLLLHEPWMKKNEQGELQYFNFGRWSKPTEEDLSQMHRTEVQLWLCVRQLLLEPRLPHYYTIDECRRNAFCRLQAKLTEPMLDQIPPLVDLKMFLCRLAVGDYSSLHNRTNGVKNPGCTLIEIVPQIKDAYLKQVHKRTKALAKAQLELLHMDGSEESRDMAKRLLESYTSDAALALDNGGAKCAKCGDKATKKCSRCKTEWYCGRECQVQQWPMHKEICDQFANLCV